MSEAGEEGWEDDEDENLFSFGTEEGGGDSPPAEPVLVEVPDVSAEEFSQRDRAQSNDSFMEMLDENAKESSTSVLDTKDTNTTTPTLGDAETQEILNWLDQDEPEFELVAEEEVEDAAAQDVSTETKESEVCPDPAPTIVVIPEREPEPTFETLAEALVGAHSSKSTVIQIQSLFVDEGMKVNEELRPELWSRIVCKKSLKDLQASSVADSYSKWQETVDLSTFKDDRSTWIKNEASILAERIANMSQEEAAKQLSMLLLFHYAGSNTKDMDPLVPPVACTILSAGLPPAASSVILSNIMPTAMPLLALTQDERLRAANLLHTQFYLLACYHLPLLVFHLDRYAPGWYWPKKLEKTQDEDQDHAWRNTENHGIVPQSWLISQMAGECHGTFMNPMWLLSLWDLILTSNNNSLRFFLSLAVLEKHSDSLLMITGNELLVELTRIMEFKEGTTLEGFAIESEEETTSSEAVDWVQEWCARARSLWESTPRSVVRRLRKAEDEAVTFALTERQQKAETELIAKLEAEAKAHKEAMEADRQKRGAEARQRLNKARLVAYYREFAPDKEGNVDTIMETFEGRFDVLDSKLKFKYGKSFNPTLPPKVTAKNASKLLSTMNIGLSVQRRRISTALKKDDENKATDTKMEHQVSVRVSPSEVLPIICWAKKADSVSMRPCDALKFYLVDSRPEETVLEQGGFPTALAMPPEALLDPDRMKQQEEIFESLRGAAHIVVMGEGFSAVPSLYGQKVNQSLTQLIAEDESRTSLCALFFAKKGFPFVSILQGGFCAAHAWLSRQGPQHNLHVNSVLVDYTGENSMFGELEKAYREQQEFSNASTAGKTSMAIEGLFVKSMTSITRNKNRIESLASGAAASGQISTESRFSSFFKADEKKKKDNDAKSSTDVSKFRMSFPGQRVAAPAKETVAAASPVPASKTIDTNATHTEASVAPSTSVKAVVSQEDPSTKGRFAALGASRFGGIGSALNNSIAKIGVDKPGGDNQQSQESRLGSLGAAFNKSLKNAKSNGTQQQLPNVLKRNPFARFGATEQSNQPKPSRFGMNKMRSQLASLRATTETEEESVIDFEAIGSN